MVQRAATETVSADEVARSARTDARTRQLLDAAARLMERSGSHGVSMQAVADEAGVSVGLIYRYFGNKQDLVQAVILGVLDDIGRLIPSSIEPVDDPVRRVAAAFSAYCTVVRDSRHAVVLTYRESNTLDEDGRRLIKDLEVRTAQPLMDAIHQAVDSGRLRPIDVHQVAFDLLVTAHSWALKHWYFSRHVTFEEFVRSRTALFLSAVLAPEHRGSYADLLGDFA